jgi:hypothetical protein
MNDRELIEHFIGVLGNIQSFHIEDWKIISVHVDAGDLARLCDLAMRSVQGTMDGSDQETGRFEFARVVDINPAAGEGE